MYFGTFMGATFVDEYWALSLIPANNAKKSMSFFIRLCGKVANLTFSVSLNCQRLVTILPMRCISAFESE
jgi:hypothetical protein